jgi:hypothetical protein
LRHVSICGVPPSSSSFSSSSSSATSPGKAKWSGPHHTIIMLHFELFHSVTCYTNSIVSRIHINTTKLRNIKCTLATTGLKLRSLQCTWNVARDEWTK